MRFAGSTSWRSVKACKSSDGAPVSLRLEFIMGKSTLPFGVRHYCLHEVLHLCSRHKSVRRQCTSLFNLLYRQYSYQPWPNPKCTLHPVPIPLPKLVNCWPSSRTKTLKSPRATTRIIIAAACLIWSRRRGNNVEIAAVPIFALLSLSKCFLRVQHKKI